MRYPSSMSIAGIDVPVTVSNEPIYTLYKCPTCRDPDTQEALTLYLKSGETTCPCCGCAIVQPTGQYTYGAYSVADNNISICASTEQMGGLNLVHETIEGINDLCDLQMDHTQISTLGAMMYKAFASGKVDFTPRSETVTPVNEGKGACYANAA